MWINRYSALTGRSLHEEGRRFFQDLDRLLLFADLLAQPLELLTLGAGQLTGLALALVRLRARYQPRRDSELMPSSRATAVTVLPEESTSAIARLNSSEYRFVYLFPTWCYFLWNLKIPVSRCPRSRGSFTSPSGGSWLRCGRTGCPR